MMIQGKKILTVSLFAATSFTALQSTSRAAIYTEIEDAAQVLPSAAATASATAPTGTSLTTILGSFSSVTDADLYAFQITAASTFSASTVNALTNTGGQDTALFLFNASGVAIATNDDASGLTLDSSLPAGNTLYANLAAGTYYLGISESGNEAINQNSKLLFAGYPGGDTTAIRGAANGVNPATEATFNGNSFGGGAGSYEIDLTSAATAANPNAVPEPSTWTAFALGSIAAGATMLRRRSIRA